MEYGTLLEIATVVAGVVMSLAYYPQAYTIWRARSAKNISVLTYSIFAVGTTMWTLYGLYLVDFTIIFGFIFGVIGSWLVLGLTLYYRRKENSKR